MRDFEQLRAFIPPLTIVPGSVDRLGNRIGAFAVGVDYSIESDGWEGTLNDPGQLTGSARTAGPWYQLTAYHRTKIEWSPWARESIAISPLGQEVSEGKNFAAFHTPWAEETTTNAGNPVLPAWSGADCRVLDIWSSEEIEERMLENLAWNMDLPGAEAKYPVDVWTASYYPKNNPGLINHKLRFDQVISARYRQMISSTNAPSSQYWGGQLVTVHDHQIGGNASMSESIHHARYVYMTVSNNGDNNISDPGGGGANLYNNLKLGFFIPSTIDTLTVGLGKIENDAEWATLARRGAYR